MRITRADKSILSDWWFTVDRLMFFGLLLLMGTGLVLSLAASPPIADKFHLEPFYFVRRQAAMLLPAVLIMFGASTLTPKQIRRASLIIFVVGIGLMALTMLVGPEIKGAKRWLQIGFISIQPSEFVKPAFIVLTAWLFNESQKRNDVPGIELALVLYGIFALLLVLEPDFGQTLLITLVWGALFFMAGSISCGSGRWPRLPLLGSPRPISSCPMWPRASTASSTPSPATPTRPIAPSNPSCAAAGSGGGPARAR
jgi:cell division protein FtsW